MYLKYIKLDNSVNEKLYNDALAKIGGKHPQYELSYLDIFDHNIEKLSCFIFENDLGEVLIILPGYLRTINFDAGNGQPLFDFTSPYGYSGPLFAGQVTDADITMFWQQLNNWFIANNVITAFIRFSLNENYRHFNGTLVNTLSNVKGTIIGEEQQWMNFDHKVRKNVNKAKREGLHTKIFYDNIDDQVIAQFYDIYIDTMRRTNAKEHFFYSIQQFTTYVNNNEGLCLIALIFFEDKAVSAELILISDDSIYSFLGGTLSEYFDKRPNDLLKHEAINWARSNNVSYYILGGGYGKDDGIFNYKKSFFPNDVVVYYTGRSVISPAIYEKLFYLNNTERKEKGLDELSITDNSFFPIYRNIN